MAACKEDNSFENIKYFECVLGHSYCASCGGKYKREQADIDSLLEVKEKPLDLSWVVERIKK